jgi:hypothetical protein
MQIIHITCRYDYLLSLAGSLEAQVADLDGVTLLDYGFSQKRIDGYVVLRWDGEGVNQTFLQQLETEETILDCCVSTVPCPEGSLFGTDPALSKAALI